MKPGWKTTEFWLTTLAVILGGVTASGAAGGGVTQGVGAIAAALAVAGYAGGRAWAKVRSGKDGKPGWKTTEFWLSLVSVVIASLLASGAIPSTGPVATVLGFAAQVLTVLGYSASRSTGKK